VARKHAYLRRRAGLSALLEDSVCCGASGNGFIRGLGAGRESPRLTPGLARYSISGRSFDCEMLTGPSYPLITGPVN
jgi:hypothetical protein